MGGNYQAPYLLQGYAGMGLIHLHSELCPDALHLSSRKEQSQVEQSRARWLTTELSQYLPYCQVLPNGLHLLTGKGVVLLLLPVGLDHAQRLLQNLQRTESKLSGETADRPKPLCPHSTRAATKPLSVTHHRYEQTKSSQYTAGMSATQCCAILMQNTSFLSKSTSL